MRCLRLCFPVGILLLISPAPAVPSLLSTSESSLIAFARGIEEEPRAGQEPSNPTNAFGKAAQQGDANSQAALGDAYFSGLGVQQDYAEAMKWYRKAADQGHAHAQAALGGMYAAGTGVPQNYTEAAKWYRKAADQGHGWAQYQLVWMYAEGAGVPQDYTKAVEWCRKAADQGDAAAQVSLAWAYSNGKGIAQDYAEAVKWYRKAADQGDADAQASLGWMFREGKGAAQDYRESMKWYRKAADQGHAEAQSGLGWMYAEGLGIPRDYTEAGKWYRKAADQGNAYAQLQLGLMYSGGKGVSQDHLEAAKLFRKGAQSWAGSHRMPLILFVLVLLILPPFLIAVLLLIVSRIPLHKSSPEAGTPEPLEQTGSGQSRYPEVIAQLGHLQNKRTSWPSAILVLVISVALFIAIGAGAWSWELLFMFVGILFVHEAGHYLAMRIFHYRNVRMFFIPFLGAAVSGQNYTAPGWKKVIVALMGPLPGIFLGSAIGVAGLIRGSESMMKIAMTAVTLNGFQLLPVLPLDGGRVMHALLFSRNHWLDAVFRALAAGALACIGFLSGDYILSFLGLFLLGGVGYEYKTARISTELRRQGIMGPVPEVPPGCEPATELPVEPQPAPQPVPESAGQVPMGPPVMTAPALIAVPSATKMPTLAPAEGDSIPQAVAEKIIERVKACFPQVNSPKQIAGLTLHVYEKMATRPPGIWASIGFTSLHYALFLVASISILLFALAGGVK